MISKCQAIIQQTKALLDKYLNKNMEIDKEVELIQSDE